MIKVLVTCHQLLSPFVGLTYDKAFVKSIIGIQGKGGVGDRLPPFHEFLSRFDAAASLYFEQYSDSCGIYAKRLKTVHGLAWKYSNQQPLDEIGNASKDPITAKEAAGHMSSVADALIKHHIGDVTDP
jgi:hypothetical protein